MVEAAFAAVPGGAVTGLAKEIWGVKLKHDHLLQGQKVDPAAFLDDEVATVDAARMNQAGVEG